MTIKKDLNNVKRTDLSSVDEFLGVRGLEVSKELAQQITSSNFKSFRCRLWFRRSSKNDC